MSSDRLIERIPKREGPESVGESERDDVRVPVVEPAPDERGGAGEWRQQRIRQVNHAEEYRCDENAFGARRCALGFAEHAGLQYPLLGPAPEQEWRKTAAKVAAVMQRADAGASTDDQKHGDERHRDRTPQPREERGG